MLRRRRLWVVLTALVLSTIWWVIDQRERDHLSRERSAQAEVARASLTAERSASKGAPAPVDPTAYADLDLPSAPPANDLKIIDRLVTSYLDREGARDRPSLGLNEDITRVLTGANPDRLVFLPPDHPAIDPAGRLCDRWGTPYLFRPLSSRALEIRSAGPDRKLFTEDDLAWPSPSPSVDPSRNRLTNGE